MIGKRSIDRVKYIFSGDPAIDRDSPALDWKKYTLTGDPKHAPVKEGCTATVFDLKRLSLVQFNHIMSLEGARQTREAIAYGVAGISNWGGTFTVGTKQSDLGLRLDDRTLEDMFAIPEGIELFGELGLRIITLNKLDPTSGQE